MSAKGKFWLAGTLLAVIGVVLVRVVARKYTQPALVLAIYAVGVLLAFGGLGLILHGVRKGQEDNENPNQR